MVSIDKSYRRICATTLLTALVIAACHAACAQDTQDVMRPAAGYWMISTHYGASVPTGNTAQTTKNGVVLNMGLGYHMRDRWSFPVNITFVLSRLPGVLVNQAEQANSNVDNGMNVLFALTLDPSFDLVRGRQWSIYATGGGGLSTKEVILLQPAPSCDEGDYGCYNSAGSDSSAQPVVDGGLGISLRVHADSNAEFYEETRYMDMFSPSEQFVGFGTAGTHFVQAALGIRFNLLPRLCGRER